MVAGKFRDKAVIRARVDVSDGLGGRTRTWADFATVFGNLKPLSSGLVVLGQQQDVSARYEFEFRLILNLPSAQDIRVVVGSTEYAVTGVLHDLDRRVTKLLLAEPARG